MADALYLYGLAPWAHHPALEKLGTNIKLLKYANLVAIYRQCFRSEFSNPEPATDPEQFNRQLLIQIDQHDAITQAVVATSPFFPTGFATLYSSKDRLLNFMSTNHKVIEAFLKSSKGHKEWAIKGYVKRKQARDYLMAQESELPQKPAGSPGQHYVKERQRTLKIERQLTQWLQTRAEYVVTNLSQLASDIIKRPLPATAQSDTEEECFGNWAFLLPDDHISTFKQTLHDINLLETPRGLYFKCTGPWALYSFSQNLPIKN
ncbi:GvpL/GvpF family gas vesicle protein [Spartinivicinus ruber]|uniref:GvpL/GvpF family gas vesicle protein n=1 Tax=Spartinivicinus ruber TaxID=2683272 RepID=UPI0013D33B9F|nr:GvpL/GvpF family gas vesicle protein [Spartinivicinus ruber]